MWKIQYRITKPSARINKILHNSYQGNRNKLLSCSQNPLFSKAFPLLSLCLWLFCSPLVKVALVPIATQVNSLLISVCAQSPETCPFFWLYSNDTKLLFTTLIHSIAVIRQYFESASMANFFFFCDHRSFNVLWPVCWDWEATLGKVPSSRLTHNVLFFFWATVKSPQHR